MRRAIAKTAAVAACCRHCSASSRARCRSAAAPCNSPAHCRFLTSNDDEYEYDDDDDDDGDDDGDGDGDGDDDDDGGDLSPLQISRLRLSPTSPHISKDPDWVGRRLIFQLHRLGLGLRKRGGKRFLHTTPPRRV